MFNIFGSIKNFFACTITLTLAKNTSHGYSVAAKAPKMNEQFVIMYIRYSAETLIFLAKQHHANYLVQWKAYIADINPPNIDGTFTRLEAQNGLLQEQYEPVRYSIIKQMMSYDNYCADRKMPYSDAWTNLLKELQPHLSGITILGSVTPS